MALRFIKALLVDNRRQALDAEFSLKHRAEVEVGICRLAVKGLVTHLRLEQSSPLPFGAVGFPFNGTEVSPDQFGLLPSWLAGQVRLLLPGGSIRVLRNPQSLELNLYVFGGAALPQGLMVVLILVTQNVTLFDEIVWKICQTRVGVFRGVLPAPRRVAAAALRAAAQAAVVGVQRAALARLTWPLTAGGIPEDLQGPA